MKKNNAGPAVLSRRVRLGVTGFFVLYLLLTVLGWLAPAPAAHGTLGGAGKVRLNATHLVNDKGLLFSGNDMALRVNDFSNRYGDVYSLGALDIARDDASARSSLIENVSGSLESGTGMRSYNPSAESLAETAGPDGCGR